MKPPITIPNRQLLATANERFDQDYLSDPALAELKRVFPHNGDLRHVLIKVVALNRLYSTQILAVEVMARHIHAIPDLDLALSEGSFDVVDKIARVEIRGKQFRFFSFATKYCSWHNPDAYPIYDSRVDDYLWRLSKQERFKDFRHEELWDFPIFKEIVTCFRDHYGLTDFSFKQIDKFIWMSGEVAADSGLDYESTAVETSAAEPQHGEMEIVIQIAGEGGTITFSREMSRDDGWQFRVSSDESSFADLLSSEDVFPSSGMRKVSPLLSSFGEGLRALDRYRWAEMHPVAVLPEFQETVFAEVESRGGQSARDRWRAALQMSL